MNCRLKNGAEPLMNDEIINESVAPPRCTTACVRC